MNSLPHPLLILIFAAPLAGLIVALWILIRPTSLGLPARSRWIMIPALLSAFSASWIIAGFKHIHPAYLAIPLGFLVFAIIARLAKRKNTLQ